MATISQTSPVELVLATNYRSVQAAIAACTPSIGEVIASGGTGQMTAFVEANIVRLAMFCNLGNSITPSQTQATAQMIISEFGNLTIADVNLIFKRAKMGEYGEFYGRLDGQMILSWCGKYLDERCSIAADQSVADAGKFKGGCLPTSNEAERVQKELRKLIVEKKK